MPTKFNLQHGDDPAQLVEAGKPLQLACGRYELTFPRESALLDGQRFIVTLKPGEAYKTPFMIRPFDGQLTVVALFPGTAVLLRGPDGEKSGTTNEAYRVPPGYTTIVASGYQAETVRIASGMAHEVTLKPLPTGTDQSGSPDTKK